MLAGGALAQGWTDLSNTTLMPGWPGTNSGGSNSVCVPDHWNSGVTGTYGTWPDIDWYSAPGAVYGAPLASQAINGCFGMFKYSGAAVDTKRNRVVLWGTGHHGINNNTFVALDLQTMSPSTATCGGVTCKITSNGTYAAGTATSGSWTRLNDPSYPGTSTCTSSCLTGNYFNWSYPLATQTADGASNSLQSYQGPIYAPKHDAFIVVGCCDMWSNSVQTSYTQVWSVDATKLGVTGAGNPWTLLNTGADQFAHGYYCTLYPESATSPDSFPATDERIICIVVGQYFEILDLDHPATWTQISLGSTMSNSEGGGTAVLDPKRRLIFYVGNSIASGASGTGQFLYSVMIDSPYTITPIINSNTSTDLTNGTCSGWAGFTGPGAQYDASINRIVGFYPTSATASAIVIFDPATMTCVTQPQLNGIGPPVVISGVPLYTADNLANNGVWGHFSYVPGMNKYVVIGGEASDVYTFALNATTTYGLGASTLTCVDRDGDGYGMGPGCTGPDADDQDASVHAMTDVCKKWNGNVACASPTPTNAQTLTVLQHLGYNPANIWYLSTSGTDAGSPPSCKNTPASPCATWSYISSSVACGDAVLFRSGTFTYSVPAPVCSSGKPAIFMSYPGELATFHNASGASGIDFSESQTFAVADGFMFNGSGSQNACLNIDEATNIVVRHVEASGCSEWGIDGQGDPSGLSGCPSSGCRPLNDITVEDSILHNSAAQHGLYYSCHEDAVCKNIFVTRTLAYNNNWNGFHQTGQFSNVHYDNTLTYSNLLSGVSWQNGTSSSFVTESVSINDARPVDMTLYDGSGSVCNGAPPYPLGTVCPWPQNNNLFDGYTFYSTGLDSSGAGQCSGGTNNGCTGLLVGRQGTCTTTACTSAHMDGNTFENMVGTINDTDANGVNHYAALQFPDTTGVTFLGTTNFNSITIYDGANPSTQYVAFTGAGGVTGLPCTGTTSLASSAGSSTKCTFGDPKFVAASTAYWNNVSSFNLKLLSTSPAYGTGTVPPFPAYDAVGTVVPTASPNMGAYQPVGGVAPTITTTSLPNGTAGVNYSQTLLATGSTPITWNVVLGSLPSWAVLNGSTGVISGTPTAGTTVFSVGATNAYGSATQALSITINSVGPETSLQGLGLRGVVVH